MCFLISKVRGFTKLCADPQFYVSFMLGTINVFGPTDGAFESAQTAGLLPTDPNGELLKN